ncbi:hypothetical protein [Sulfurovum sp.]|uniref:hypothetical protein n=1 Tax=Sulfurovum sp. TaxID=1969726 RepID=UPI0035650E30
MGIKKFIKKVKSTLGLNNYEVEDKKKSLKDLLKKLNRRKKCIKKSLENANKKEKKELNEDLDIITCQIKKGKNILHKLYSK